MKANRNFSKDEEAVSPVIGVILMVAITVILAAVIAAFVFNMGGNLSTAPPTVSIIATNNAADSDKDIKIVHSGGDLLKGTEWKISVVPEGTTPVYVTSYAGDDFAVGSMINMAGETTDLTGTTDGTYHFSNGTTPWEYAGTPVFDISNKYDIKIVHIPSNSLVLDTAVEVR